MTVGNKKYPDQKLAWNSGKLTVERSTFYCAHSNQVFALRQDNKENYSSVGYWPVSKSIKLGVRKATHQIYKVEEQQQHCHLSHYWKHLWQELIWTDYREEKAWSKHPRDSALPRSTEIESCNHQPCEQQKLWCSASYGVPTRFFWCLISWMLATALPSVGHQHHLSYLPGHQQSWGVSEFYHFEISALIFILVETDNQG